jgi:uncharacterized protein with LGFP repeats
VTGAHALSPGASALWTSLGQEGGGLGYPTDDERCGLTAGGCTQAFQGGTLARSATGAPHARHGALGTAWTQAGADAGPLGYPTAEAICSADGCGQVFQRGALTWTGPQGVRVLTGGIALLWERQGGGSGPLGYATGDVSCGLAAGGCTQAFTGGTAYWSPATLEHAVRGDVAEAYAQLGAQDGFLGYPTGEVACTAADSCSQPFQHGWLAGTGATGVRPVTGGFALVWAASGGARGWLGYPVADAVCTPSGACGQQFQNGWLSWTSAAGVRAVSGAIGWTWAAGGGVGGWLGAATGDVVCGLTGGGCTQRFANGTYTWSPATGVHAVSGAIAFTWTTVLGGDRGGIGWPTADAVCVASGCGQTFQGGALTWTPAGGVHLVFGGIGTYWSSRGGTTGQLGPATSDVDCTLPSGGCAQRFTGGTVTSQATAGTHAVTGALLSSWTGQGGARGSLGLPTGEATPVAGGLSQSFQGGTLTWNSTTGVVTRS